ncbi:GyrI-like domain-containing protein [Halobacteriovorax sp. HLS]|uniref:AraC family transcriptional regulator n=1 Tax=Halobacteriovorax sp. HLS TaxID=2234000 RepID=UPI000FDCB37B|nr:AraC family transcriptional regulator [Halobacteriovorax sp. HLS]
MATTIVQKHFHRLQISRALIFLKDNLDKKLTLAEIARASGASQYHFIRVFSAYTGETPFSFIARERTVQALQLLIERAEPIINISQAVGFDSSSSFNKAFKRITSYSPSEFRNLGKDLQESLIYSLSMTPKTKEKTMNFKMNLTPEIIKREKTVIYSSNATGGEFKDIAPLAWENFLKVLGTIKEDLSQSEFLGVGTMDKSDTKQVCNYKAALSVPTDSKISIPDLEKEEIPASKYAKFLLEGTYDNVWIAFEKAFEVITEGAYELADAPCLENYLNDPNVTPENELLTEILIPIK